MLALIPLCIHNCLAVIIIAGWLLPCPALQVRKKPKEWIPDAVWLNIIALSNMDAFRDIPDSVFRNDGLWRQWYDQEAPEMAKVLSRITASRLALWCHRIVYRALAVCC
jgi:hypothetical protein